MGDVVKFELLPPLNEQCAQWCDELADKEWSEPRRRDLRKLARKFRSMTESTGN